LRSHKLIQLTMTCLFINVILLMGCTNNPVMNEQSDTSTKPLITMTISLQQGSLFEGIQSDPVVQEIERRLGIQLDFQTLNDDQFMLQAAVGDLPDIILAPRSWLKILIDGDNIVPLDGLIEKAPNVSRQKKRIQFAKQYLSEGRDQLYALSTNAGPVTIQYKYDVGPQIRWDYYRELGYPDMHNTDDFLAVLKQMQNNHPITEDGNNVYGFSLWNDWGIWPYKLYHTYGNGLEQLGTMEYNEKLIASNFLLNESSAWWEGIRFYYKANRMGLLDPESFGQKLDNMYAKGTNGQILATYASWTTQLNTELAKKGMDTSGFMPIPGIFPYVFHGGFSDTGLQDNLLVITNNNRYPERAMELIDFIFSEEGSRMLWSGIEGTHWSRDEGVAKLDDKLFREYDIVSDEFTNETGITKYHKLAGFNGATVHSDGQRMNIAISPELFVKYKNPLDEQYNEHYQVDYPGQLYDQLVEEHTITLLEINTDFQVATGSVPEHIKRIDDSLIDYISKQVVRMILAQSDVEFDEQMRKAIDEMIGMGLNESDHYWQDVFARTRESMK
jgi:putative aldouronate transport system substrate-binding protein